MEGQDGAHQVQVLGVCATLAVTGTRDQRIRALAGAQHRCVSRSQLLKGGITYKAISARVKNGQLLPFPGGVFSLAPLDTSELTRHAAALLAVGFEAVIGGVSALNLWGLLDPPAPSQPIHVLAPLGVRRSLEAITVHRTRRLAPEHVRIRHGLPVASPARALLDAAAQLPLRRLQRAFDEGLVRRLIYRQDIARVLAGTSGRHEASVLQALLDRETDTLRTRSRAERKLIEMLRAANLPPFQTNVWLEGFEVDVYWPERRLVVELDGFQSHSNRSAFERDHLKDSVLRKAGFDVRRFTPHLVTSNPYAVIADVAQGLWAGESTI